MKKQIIFISAILTLNIVLIFFPISVKAAAAPELCWETIKEDTVDSVKAIAIDSSNYIYAVGTYLVKFNHKGVEQWSHRIEGPFIFDKFDPYIEDIAIDSEDNIYAAGSYYSKMILIKYDKHGTQLWNRTWGGDDYDKGRSLVIDEDTDDIYITGETESFGVNHIRDIFLVKYDKTGLLLGNVTWDGYGNIDRGYGIALDQSTKDVYITGTTDTGTSDDIVLLKMDTTGDLKWNKTWDGGYDDRSRSITVDHSGKIIIAGWRRIDALGNNQDLVLLKYHETGENDWEIQWGSAVGSESELAWDVAIDSNNSIYITGEQNAYFPYGLILMKYDDSGEFKWRMDHGKGGGYLCNGYGVALDSQGNIFVGGMDGLAGNDFHMILLKYGNPSCEQSNGREPGGIPSYGMFFLICLFALIIISGIYIIKNISIKN